MVQLVEMAIRNLRYIVTYKNTGTGDEPGAPVDVFCV